MKISGIMYMGCKKQLINKGLVDFFPTNIKTLYEPFSGSAIVSMNTSAERYVLSDINSHLIDLYNLFKNTDSNEIINHIYNRIDEYNLPKIRTKKDGSVLRVDEIREPFKQAYNKFRDYYNSNKNVLDFYTLCWFSFSQQFRFNQDGDFNMPFGCDTFTQVNEKYVRDTCDFFKNKNVHFEQTSFKDIKLDVFKQGDFVYLDPPYAQTGAVYNEGNREFGGWTEQDDDYLFDFCEKLNDMKISWGISDVFSNRGKTNNHIIDWCKNKGWNIIHFDKNYSFKGCDDSGTDEVFISNYKPIENIFDL